MRKYFRTSVGAVLLVLVLCVPGYAHAATLSITPSTKSVSVGDIVTLTVQVNSAGTAINNAEGVVSFSPSQLSVLSVSKNNSIFTLWIQEPTFSNSAGTVSFNGGVANPGYSGSGGALFTVTFQVLQPGTATISLQSAAVRANDGLGTDVMTAANGATLTLESEAGAS